ncbi:hypothetical protein DAI22_08g041100 [Oryza sativa Japonica Group]|nr:hypothetical protein DAI22_08g041100 [Oryza sativa Japonica Group]
MVGMIPCMEISNSSYCNLYILARASPTSSLNLTLLHLYIFLILYVITHHSTLSFQSKTKSKNKYRECHRERLVGLFGCLATASRIVTHTHTKKATLILENLLNYRVGMWDREIAGDTHVSRTIIWAKR